MHQPPETIPVSNEHPSKKGLWFPKILLIPHASIWEKYHYICTDHSPLGTTPRVQPLLNLIPLNIPKVSSVYVGLSPIF